MRKNSRALASHFKIGLKPGSQCDADKDADTSVSEDAGAGLFPVLRPTSVHRTKNTLRQWSGAAK